MTTDSPRSRRAVLRAAGTAVALTVSALLAGCGASPVPTSAPTPAATPAPSALVMIIRHGERPDDAHPGIDADGNQDDSSLSQIGWDRAHALVGLFDPAQASVRRGLARPKAIYAAGENDNGDGARTRETVKPLADQLGIRVNTSYGKGDEKALVKDVTARPGPTLISWQHGEIPDIVAAFPSVTPKPPSEWPDDTFDVVWTLTKTADGWHFAQLPELVLPQDKAETIRND
jgi:broad specificity phosphatase PhoE